MTRKERLLALQRSGIFFCEITVDRWVYCYLLDSKFGDIKDRNSYNQNVYYFYRFLYWDKETDLSQYDKPMVWFSPVSCTQVDFETVLDNASPEIQEKLLFNLDLFL